MILPVPTSSRMTLRKGDFSNLPESLAYAARGESGITLYSGRGEIVENLLYRDLRDEALAIARKLRRIGLRPDDREIGRAHVCTPVTNPQLVCRHLLETKKH